MRQLYIIIALLAAAMIGYSMRDTEPWLTDYELAKSESEKSGKPVFLYFSGSDWCGVCMKMKKEILSTREFESYANENLILLMADFPRMKKHKLDEKTTKQNESLAAKYNQEGAVPYSVLLNAEGDILKTWSGFPEISAKEFIEQLKKYKKSM